MTDIPVHPELGNAFSYRQALDELFDALGDDHATPNAQEIAQVVVQVGALLLKKNAAYGDSALNPLSVFAGDISVKQRLGVRMDDKLSRIARGSNSGEDVVMDLMGYLVLLRIAECRA